MTIESGWRYCLLRRSGSGVRAATSGSASWASAPRCGAGFDIGDFEGTVSGRRDRDRRRSRRSRIARPGRWFRCAFAWACRGRGGAPYGRGRATPWDRRLSAPRWGGSCRHGRRLGSRRAASPSARSRIAMFSAAAVSGISAGAGAAAFAVFRECAGTCRRRGEAQRAGVARRRVWRLRTECGPRPVTSSPRNPSMLFVPAHKAGPQLGTSSRRPVRAPR